MDIKDYKPIDVWQNVYDSEAAKKMLDAPEMEYVSKVEKIDSHAFSMTPEEVVAEMDEAGVDIGFLAQMQQGMTFRMGTGYSSGRMALEFSYKSGLKYIEKYPSRFRCLYGINPWKMMEAVKELETAVKEYGFVGAVTHVGGFAPYNDKIWYPFYAKCCELDIPIISQIGHFGETMAQDFGRPLYIDEVARHFPELKIVAGHTGWPWCDELISIALKNPNVYISMEAHLPRYWDASMVKYLDTRGRDKCLWGTDFPITRPKRNLEQVAQLGLREETLKAFLRNNTIRLYKLDLPEI